MPEDLLEVEAFQEDQLVNESFSKRLITGIAAEGFFESAFPTISDFANHTLVNVTRFGCGFDFRVQPEEEKPYLAVEVKGIAGANGFVTLTNKEHTVANHFGDRYFLCVVRNFVEKPQLKLFQNPLKNGFEFTPREQIQTNVTWHSRVPS